MSPPKYLNSTNPNYRLIKSILVKILYDKAPERKIVHDMNLSQGENAD